MPDAPLLIYPRDLVSEETPEQLEPKACEVAAGRPPSCCSRSARRDAS